MVTQFTPWLSLAGGVMIGLAATALMAMLGRIMGASGLVSGLLRPTSGAEFGWRAALLAGMVSGPLVLLALTGSMPPLQVPSSPMMLVLGGLLVGVGVTYASGCTSGHGVCGNARLSPRSFVATVSFMLAAFVTVFVVRHLLPGLVGG
ncbi:YeeE/YedE family protein [Paracoccus jeotgali]|uniref:YeeE/YedE family protein n=1 Tax=Paracoccus jeotgali TaxID=2065379 RepID=UPI0028AF2D81|nr:YeeE/YedE thiosulfate transporter family protein [Paracoccus jeotgali]